MGSWDEVEIPPIGEGLEASLNGRENIGHCEHKNIPLKIYRKASLYDPCTASVAFTISRTESTRARCTEFGKRAYPVARWGGAYTLPDCRNGCRNDFAIVVAIAVANFEMFDYHQQIAFRAKCWQSVQTAVTSFSLHDENEDFPSRRDFSIPCFRPGVLQRVF